MIRKYQRTYNHDRVIKEPLAYNWTELIDEVHLQGLTSHDGHLQMCREDHCLKQKTENVCI